VSSKPGTESGGVVKLDAERLNRARPAPLSILFVEDDEIDAKLIELALSKSAWFEIEVTRARTIDEAKAFCQMASFDLMLLDFWLGPDNGLLLLEELGGRLGRLPVVLLTGYTDQDVQRLGHIAGALSFLSKDDVSSNSLDATIRSTLHTHELERGLLASIVDRDDALRSQLDVLAGISREVDRPLQNISDAAAAIKQRADLDMPPGQVTENAAIIAESVSELRKTVQQLIERVRDEKQHVELLVEPLDLGDLIAKAIRLSASQFNERGQTVLFVKPGLAVIAKVDQTAILQALLNIFSNASKFAGTDTATEVSLEQQGGDAVITISDAGVGMSEREIELALDPIGLNRKGSKSSHGEASPGLGLQIAVGILRQHGGQMAIESTEGSGTVVRLILPVLN
jgi:signal transduction histidine kinase